MPRRFHGPCQRSVEDDATSGALGNGARAVVQGPNPNALVINPAPGFELSPYLYMQFMEPLGATDGSVEAAWDHLTEQWRDDVVAVTKELAPPMMRLG
jgi:alpha-N-arabinofuranosidase